PPRSRPRTILRPSSRFPSTCSSRSSGRGSRRGREISSGGSMTGERYDVAILGGGPGGYVAAIRAGQLGLKTALIEKDRVGGTCLHRGCIPTKALLETAEVLLLARRAGEFGVRLSEASLDLKSAMDRKDRVVKKNLMGTESLLKKNKVVTIKGEGRLEAKDRIEVTDAGGAKSEVAANAVVLATGSRVGALPMAPVDGTIVLSSDDILNLDRIPESLLVIAAGRKPNTEKIGLESLGVQVERGFVRVNEMMETNVPGIYAIGDIVPGPALAHVASHEGRVAVEKIAGKDPHPVNYQAIPSCTYCHPQIASVGMTEAQARASGRAVKTGKFPFIANAKAGILGEGDGFVKAVSDATSGELLGVHIIGVLATEQIAESVVAR